MDKQISEKSKQKEKQRSWIRTFAIVAVIALLFWGFREILRPKLNKNDFIIATVERGDVQNALTASGLIVPAYEIELNAPINSEIKNVMLSSGNTVQKGDLIMELDDKYITLQYEQLRDEWELKSNNIGKLKLEFDKSLRDLDLQNQIKILELEGLEAQLKDFQRLLSIGGATAEDVEKASLNVNIAKLQNAQLANELDFRNKSNKSDKRNLELELNIQAKKLTEFKTKKDETAVRAPQNGVITWVNKDLGRKINEGELIARIANLDQFSIEASCSDRYIDDIKIGMRANVRINDKILEGRIESILPEVENNTLKFTIRLENPDAEQLRPNMRVEAFIVTDEKKDVLRIKKGPAFKGAKQQQIFVIRENKAIKMPATLGISSLDFIEINGNIRKGDRIIISDISDYEHLDEFEIND